MKKIILFSLSMNLLFFIQAQTCSVSIPSSSEVIKSNSTISNTNGMGKWICPGLVVSVDARDNFLYVEENCTINLNTNQVAVRIKGGGTVNINGDSNLIFHESSTTVNVQSGIQNQVIPCPTGVTYSYANAPANGCSPVGMKNFNLENDVIIYPNPADNLLFIKYKGVQSIEYYKLMNVEGKAMLEGYNVDNEISLDVSSLNSGIYILQLTTDNALLVKKVLIE